MDRYIWHKQGTMSSAAVTVIFCQREGNLSCLRDFLATLITSKGSIIMKITRPSVYDVLFVSELGCNVRSSVTFSTTMLVKANSDCC